MTAIYVRYLNIQRFEQLLVSETDPEKRATIQRLLDEERAKAPGEHDDGPLRRGADEHGPMPS